MFDRQQQIADLEAEIERLTDGVQQCRKIELVAKGAIAAGCAVLLAAIVGPFRSEPLMFVLGVAAALGGTVLLGSNKRTLEETLATIEANEARRVSVIDQMELRTVDPNG